MSELKGETCVFNAANLTQGEKFDRNVFGASAGVMKMWIPFFVKWFVEWVCDVVPEHQLTAASYKPHVGPLAGISRGSGRY